jgi:hypothetical protein
MAASLRNLLILDKYYLGRSQWVPGRTLQTWPDFLKACQLLYQVQRRSGEARC